MTIQTAIWIPPSQCGCQLQITADFTDGSVINGISSRHPIPFTVQNVQIVTCCARHQSVIAGSMPDTTHLFETDQITGLPVQRRGYLQFPIASPTPDQILYHYLCGHKGQTHSYPCGCQAYMWGDFSGSYTHAVRDGVTQKCINHKNDTVDMQQAAADFNTLNTTVGSS